MTKEQTERGRQREREIEWKADSDCDARASTNDDVIYIARASN